MESSASISTDDDVPTEIPGWEVSGSGIVLNIEAQVVRRRPHDVLPPQLILYFCREIISPSTHTVDVAYFTISQPYQNIINEAGWDVETQWMLSHVVADCVPAAVDLAFFLLAFRRYTTAVLDFFPIMELSTMEFYSIIEIPPIAPYSTSAGHLHDFMPPPERQQDFLEDNDDDDEPIVRTAPAPAAVVEGLKMKIAEEPDVCSICLDDFNTMTRVMEMPCRHIFHSECLRQWLARSNTCPLCRFRLHDAE